MKFKIGKRTLHLGADSAHIAVSSVFATQILFIAIGFAWISLERIMLGMPIFWETWLVNTLDIPRIELFQSAILVSVAITAFFALKQKTKSESFFKEVAIWFFIANTILLIFDVAIALSYDMQVASRYSDKIGYMLNQVKVNSLTYLPDLIYAMAEAALLYMLMTALKAKNSGILWRAFAHSFGIAFGIVIIDILGARSGIWNAITPFGDFNWYGGTALLWKVAEFVSKVALYSIPILAFSKITTNRLLLNLPIALFACGAALTMINTGYSLGVGSITMVIATILANIEPCSKKKN